MKKNLSLTLAWLLLVAPLAYALPPDSIYQVPMSWVDETNTNHQLSDYQGKEVILTMAFTSCQSACPLTMQRLKKIDRALKEQGRSAEFVVVSLDPERDTPQQMADYKSMQDLNLPYWHFLHGSAENVRKLSLLLGISFQKNPKSGEIMHSNKILYLTPEGVIGVVVEGLNSEVAPLVSAVSVGKPRGPFNPDS